ncbi:ubiquitin carboxyl-terminal hydrolase 37-like [Cyclopterus lumpus]|uniref:ubiquitin carboxyl-terminal hydrolase 37-like n=1 Tax=Cyclopterus lumpus TaxID=8103 RepID=UPI001486B3AE|nr:ubiquitin carboxyl-terminal hydrolase 37-like [Cyclopterus lumpus]
MLPEGLEGKWPTPAAALFSWTPTVKERTERCLPDDDHRREEMSRQEAELSSRLHPSWRMSRPAAQGVGHSDAHDLAYRTDLLETDSKQPSDVLDSLDLTMDENKENQTLESVQQQCESSPVWTRREEQELPQVQSLQEHVRSHDIWRAVL